MWGVLTPTIVFWIFGSPRGLKTPIFGNVSGDLTLPSKWGSDMLCMTVLGIWERPRSNNVKRFFEPLGARPDNWWPLSFELDVLPLPIPTLEGGCGPSRQILFRCSCSRLIRELSSVSAFYFVCWRDWTRWGCGQEWYIQFHPYLAPPTNSIRI
jgi:hypothetical protein